MKKNLYFAFLSAFALTGVLGISSCSSSDDAVVENQNPTYDPATNSVNTQFVLNVAYADQQTRQSAVTVQKNHNFRGMADAKLIGLSTGKANTFVAPYDGGATSGYTVVRTYDLGTLYGSTAVDNTGTNNNDNSSHRIVELQMPLKTDAMLVYGRAIAGTDNAENGKVTDNITAAPENITFDLNQRLADATEYEQTCNIAAVILNRVMLSKKDATTYDSEHPVIVNGYAQTQELPALTWRGIGTLDEANIANLAPLQQNLAKAYQAMVSYATTTTAIRAGSAKAIYDQIKDLLAIANTVEGAVATSQAELNAQLLAREIKNRINNYFENQTTGLTFKTIGSMSQTGTIMPNLVSSGFAVEADFTGTGKFAKVKQTNLENFPISFNLPEGVSQLYFTAYESDDDKTNGFSYTSPSQSLIEISSNVDPTKYMYPAELMYFDNSLLRVSDNDKAASDYPNGIAPWNTESNWSDWTIGAVTASTRSVAVKNNINYGVAMLEATVALDGTSFQDNRDGVYDGQSAQTLSETDVKKFTLTGILIGDQYKQVGWNYINKSSAAANKDFIIYDSKIANDGKVPSETGKPNYTLVFDNYSLDASQHDVSVALEFKNGEKDFYGIGGMIPANSTFYLVAKLKVDDNKNTTFAWPTDYAIPPYTAAGGTTDTKRVFIQDYVTTATFKIGATSLKNAYSTVPDLRATQTSLGLSVDLQWRPGLSFETVLGQ